ncbi:hypothetical protein [Bifidobacterium primatium]|uniref:hypothetical protein n=1 Tax=Bifidobacterium primatium TaxID=2045438 RepID=UPI0010555078|nr:hypothetical protein [Bifidobacterium primatium]
MTTNGTNENRDGANDAGTSKSGWKDIGRNKPGWNAGWGNGKIRGKGRGFVAGRHGGTPFKATGHKGGISRQG